MAMTFFIVGDRDTCNEFANQLRKSLIVKVRGILGPMAEKGDIQEIIALNRILRWRRINNFDQIEIEGDPRHAALIVYQSSWLTAEFQGFVNSLA